MGMPFKRGGTERNGIFFLTATVRYYTVHIHDARTHTHHVVAVHVVLNYINMCNCQFYFLSTVLSLELLLFALEIPGVRLFLINKINQDPLDKFCCVNMDGPLL
jgi:hypothetical protein